MSLAALALGLSLEALIGEPARWHPLAGFGTLANTVERRLNTPHAGVLQGSLAWALLILPGVALGLLLHLTLGWVGDGLALWFALGAKSLYQHVKAIETPLLDDDLAAARQAVSRIVSRDCTRLDDSAVSKAALESLLENGSDAVVASLFWFAVAGAPGVIAHRLCNTLDAMWGYRTPRFILFGRCAARADDLLNYLPARLTAVAYALCGSTRTALRAWQQQAPDWDSPNAGPVMASGAGALQLTLGGTARYHGKDETRPPLGYGAAPQPGDLSRGIALYGRSLALLAILLAAWELLV